MTCWICGHAAPDSEDVRGGAVHAACVVRFSPAELEQLWAAHVQKYGEPHELCIEEPGGQRRYLGDRPLSCGSHILLLAGGTHLSELRRWIPVRYEASGLGSDNRAHVVEYLYLGDTNRVQLDDDSIIRWPRT